MKRQISKIIFTLVITSVSLSAAAVSSYIDSENFARISLEGINTIAINIDPPFGNDYATLRLTSGVSKEDLKQQIEQKLRNAGFNVISFEQSLENPEAVVLNLRMRLVMPWSLFYQYNLDLSLKQKMPLPTGNNAFYSVETWSDGLHGAVSQSDLKYLNNYSLQLVDNFISACQAQN